MSDKIGAADERPLAQKSGNAIDITGTDLTVDGKLKRALDMFLAGGKVSALPTGLSIAGKIDQVALTTAGWLPLPATPLANRNAVGIQNTSNKVVLINYVSTVGVTVGWEINPGGELFLAVTDSIIVYGRMASGTATVTTNELS